MQSAVCSVPVSPMRATASHKAEMVSELLFGESCTILERTQDHWARIKCNYDGYEGWCQENHLTELDEAIIQPGGLTRKWVTEIEFNGWPMQVPLGSVLPSMKKGSASLKNNRIQYKGKLWNPSSVKKNKAEIKKLAYSFINTPYLWGGRTVFGTDCSGYTQTVFRFFNIALLRDAWQQAMQGNEVNALGNVAFGDLAFFDNAEGKITHVGILLGKHKIIHASGKVRIDRIGEDGIIHAETGLITHKLKLIKRYF